ncbi:response regulator transcription factor [Membranihabitans maritimus]|uniref:response regulator transcription factor n=1 Tax=Membranihabitans maritimus TaxID=2904244 RepID=UPI001EFF8C79|nr:LuxR C-terminal-related transcriptional regulator [Membranihabitans maritimus]
MDHSVRKLFEVYDRASPYLSRQSSKFNKAQIRDLLSNIYAPGPTYHGVFDFSKFEFDYLSDNIQYLIGEDPETFSAEDYFAHIHPEDREYYQSCEEMLFDFLFNYIERKDIPYYKVSYQFRVQVKSEYKLFLHQSIAIDLDEKGNLVKTFISETDISHITSVNNKKITLIGLEGRPSYYNIGSLEDVKNYRHEPERYSPREVQIIRLLSEGLSNKDVGRTLDISTETVRTHRKNILNKSNSNNTVEVVALAIRKGLI